MDEYPALMAKFNEYITQYEEALIPKVENDGVAESVLNFSTQELRDLTSEESYMYAYSLNSYALFLQRELDINRSRLLWCEEAVNSIIGKNYSQYNGSEVKYMPYEAKRQLIISENSAARELEQFRIKLVASNNMLFNKIKIILAQSEVLTNLGKKKSYG
jgi:hypothetical protein